tara:strand:+ start:74 stop:1231 length:1158 start_codon:yes stop_codon:yes gene_type:complete
MDNNLEQALKASGYTLESGEPVIEQAPQPEIIDATSLRQEQNVSNETTEQSQEPAVAEPQQTASSATVNEVATNDNEVDVPQSSLEPAEEPEMSQEEFESNVAQFISEKLGLELSSIEQLSELLNAQKQPADIDERVKAIADFVSETGRDPQDWFTYQSLNPTEMGDLAAVKLQMAVEYPNLATEEIDMLLGSKYKIDEDLYSDDEIKLSKLQLKIDAQKSRSEIERIRDSYKAPVRKEEPQQQEVQSPITKEWIKTMSDEVDSLEALTFELGGTEFNFGIKPEYRSQLKQKNVKLDEFFDQYVSEDGSWNFEMLNSHRAVIDNIDDIAKSIYNQGLSDGQRRLVEKTANVDISGPRPTADKTTNSVYEQVLNALGNDKTLKFKP